MAGSDATAFADTEIDIFLECLRVEFRLLCDGSAGWDESTKLARLLAALLGIMTDIEPALLVDRRWACPNPFFPAPAGEDGPLPVLLITETRLLDGLDGTMPVLCSIPLLLCWRAR